jgi:excinuclease UvrABC helicase subunit UvrB
VSPSNRKSYLAKNALGTGGSSWKVPSQSSSEPAKTLSLDLIDDTNLPEMAKELAGEYFKDMKSIEASITKMEDAMRSEAKKMKFEAAAELRDRIRSLKAIALKLR